jgi:asparagine synthase (glutamine-hydrolysing)
MCGITGFLELARRGDADHLRETARCMAQAIAHRGPDDHGVWIDTEIGLSLGHQRLSIVDLSPQGHQPMVSASRRHVLVYNGEIYNHNELRRDLESQGVVFRGRSDSETLLEAIDHWGVDRTLARANGMFAFAVWDTANRKLTLARDRLGIKPLYYGWSDDTFLFGSELKAIRAHPAFRGEVDREALCLYLQHSYVPTPFSIYKDIRKLPPAAKLTIAGTDSIDVLPETYWSLKDVAERGTAEPFSGSSEEAVEQLDRRLRDAVRDRLMSDVPLGAFLSGGIDSSAVVALMQAEGDARAKTFSIGFHEAGYNEEEHASRVAGHLNTDHVSLYVTSQEARDVIPRLPAMYDEPFADSSQIPTFLVSQLARQHVTVALSGDGGDELFGGYERYALMAKIWKRIGWLPQWQRRAMAKAIRTIVSARSTRLRKLRTLAGFLEAADAPRMYSRFHTHWKEPQELVIGGNLPSSLFYECDDWAKRDSLVEELMFIDGATYLPDDILTKVDRASMAVGLEARVPLLDHRVVEFAWTLPQDLKVRGSQSKWILRRALEGYIPRELIERPKMGFGVPIDQWLRGPLREWADALLASDRLEREGFFHPAPIRERWQQHTAGTHNWHYYLWDILIFQAWRDNG